MRNQNLEGSFYHRYHIETIAAPDIVRWPTPFLVKVNRIRLAKLLIQEFFKQRGDLKAITSRPCIYGTFSGPVGGFAPRPEYCVGCLRCTTEHPDTVTILNNPTRRELGDSFFTFEHVNAISYEARTGNIPVKGAGYRGKFGGEGWDGMWTDMSEIVRPTRDGIHGREVISTFVDIGEKPAYLIFDDDGQPVGPIPRVLSIPIPFIYDILPASVSSLSAHNILIQAAKETGTFAVVPVKELSSPGWDGGRATGNQGMDEKQTVEVDHDGPKTGYDGRWVIPLIELNEVDQLEDLPFNPLIIEVDGTRVGVSDLESALLDLQKTNPDAIISLRYRFGDHRILLRLYEKGYRVFHLTADYHGRDAVGGFILDSIQRTHRHFIEAGIRDEVTLIGSGGIVAAEHVPKAIICGLDLVALDTALLVAMQAAFMGDCIHNWNAEFSLPKNLSPEWAVQRIKNMSAAWRDQMLEIIGAMGMREVRRLRGEMGRAMFQVELEKQAFAGISGYS
jgi:hypothetical protein